MRRISVIFCALCAIITTGSAKTLVAYYDENTAMSINVIVGNNMPFNKIKCPTCQGEDHDLIKTNNAEYEYVCRNCKTHFDVALEDIIKKI